MDAPDTDALDTSALHVERMHSTNKELEKHTKVVQKQICEDTLDTLDTLDASDARKEPGKDARDAQGAYRIHLHSDQRGYSSFSSQRKSSEY